MLHIFMIPSVVFSRRVPATGKFVQTVTTDLIDCKVFISSLRADLVWQN